MRVVTRELSGYIVLYLYESANTILHGGSGVLMAVFNVTMPDGLDFSCPEDWPRWIRRFERFRVASGLTAKDEAIQVNTLIYNMGDQADDILISFSLSEDDKKKYEIVKGKFESHFVKRRNTIFERARFNQRRQEEDESVDSFITDLYGLSEHCSYGAIRDEMIRDRLVVGLRDAALSEKLLYPRSYCMLLN